MIRRTCLQLPLAIASLVFANSAGAEKPTGRIRVELSGFASDGGFAMLSLHNQPDAFPRKPKKAFRQSKLRIKNKRVSVTMDGVPAGDYAISVFHDENANGELDTNFIGMPKEAVGASNNAKGSMGPPKWKDAKFRVNQSAVTQRIRLKEI